VIVAGGMLDEFGCKLVGPATNAPRALELIGKESTKIRAQGIPARARCGFGAYFEKHKCLDHWVTEYWNEEKKCWVLFDSQIDNRQRELIKIGFDTADVPRDQFVVAGDAWSLCRGGRTDPSAFGILDIHGLWFVAGNLIRDVAALNNREMLLWTLGGECPGKTANWISPFSIDCDC
jgi:hypothetical protein